MSYLIPQVSSLHSLLPVHKQRFRSKFYKMFPCFHFKPFSVREELTQELTPYRILAVFVGHLPIFLFHGSLPLLAHIFCNLVANLLPCIFLLPLLKTNSTSSYEHCFLPARNALEARAFGHPGSAGSDTTIPTGSIWSRCTSLP